MVVVDANLGQGLAGGDGASSSRRQRIPSRAMWVSSEPTVEEVADLRRRFPEVVQLPEGEVGEEELRWTANAVVLRSLGRRVAAEAVARAFRLRTESKGDVEVIPIGQEHLIARLKCTEDRERVLNCPWVVSGQLMAVERWRPRFRPSPEALKTAMVWVRLPSLPLELWGPESLRAIARFAGEVVDFDPWTLKRARGAFAKVAVRVDLSKPLRPGVLLGGVDGVQWQAFVYEEAAGVCLQCGCFHGAGRPCEDRVARLRPENVTGAGEGVQAVGRPALGSWVLAVKQWIPRKEDGGVSGLRQNRPGSGFPPPMAAAARTGGSPEDAGWSKPAKVARRTPTARTMPGGGEGGPSSGRFTPLRAVPDGGGTVEGGASAGTANRKGLSLGTSNWAKRLKEGVGVGDLDLKDGSRALDPALDGIAWTGSDSSKTKRPRSPARVQDRGGSKIGSSSKSNTGSRKGRGKKGKEVCNLVSTSGPVTQGETAEARVDGGIFVFAASQPEGDPQKSDELTKDPLSTDRLSHEAVIGRLRQIMQTDAEDSSHQMMDEAGIREDDRGEGSSGNDPSRLSVSG